MGESSIRRVFIYGSRVRGRSWRGEPIRADSDLDIAIEPVDPADERPLAYMDEVGRWRDSLSKVLPWHPHVEFYEAEGARKFVFAGVCESGRLVYIEGAG